MKKETAEGLTTEQLVVEFMSAAHSRGTAILDMDTARANQTLDKLQVIDSVLRARGVDARMSLFPLLRNSDRSIRYFAAMYMLGLCPIEARQVIEEIARPKFDPICTDAGMCLYTLDTGIFKPD